MTTAQTTLAPKKGPGRPKKTEAEKAEDAQWKSEGKDPKVERAKLKAQTKTTEHDRVVVDDLSDDQHFGLMLHHSRKIATVEGLMEKVKKDLKSVRDLARSELGKDALHEIKLYRLLESDEGQERLKQQMQMQARIARWQGMPIGHQDDIFAEDRTPVEDKIFADGKKAGLNGEGASPPSHLSGPSQQKWLQGHQEGQAVLAKGFKTHKPEGDEFGAPPAEPINWYAAGAEAFVQGKNDDVPDTVPEEHRDDFKTGYAKAAEANAKRMDAKKRDGERAAA